jgi:hypothetical protein
MFRLMKILFKVALVCGVGLLLFAALMFASGIWGIYSIPPTKENPRGATLIVKPYDDEPFFNAPDRPRPPESISFEPEPPSGIYPRGPMKRRPAEQRTIASFPYIKWIHDRAVDTTKSK